MNNDTISVKAVLFDAGNTLVQINYKFIADCLEEEGILVSEEYLWYSECFARVKLDERIRSGELKKHDDFFIRFISMVLDGVGVICGRARKTVIRKAVLYHQKNNLWNKVNNGSAELLEILHEKGFLLGVVSNSEGAIALLLDKLGLSHYFTVIIDSTLVGVEKPDPKIFRLALDELEIASHEAVYIGDVYSIDVVGSQRAGIESILLDPLEEWKSVECRKAKDLSEIHKWVSEGILIPIPS